MKIEKQLSDEEQEVNDEYQLLDEEEEVILDNLDLQHKEKLYKNQHNNFYMLSLWYSYKKCGYDIPELLQEDINSYLLAQLKNERSRYKEPKRTRQTLSRRMRHLLEIDAAENKARLNGSSVSSARKKTIDIIAEKEGVYLLAVNDLIGDFTAE